MCGISGIVSPHAADLQTPLAAMLAAQAHRGPNASGTYFSDTAPVALGHNRLSIHDLTEAGAQPMKSACGRWVLVLNGEIYNFKALRQELKLASDVRFRGDSDTEVLVEALSLWGFDTTLARIDGMFAFAAWDVSTSTLYLARDRLGEKPLHYGLVNGMLTFASELGAIAAVAATPLPLNPEALPLFLQFSYVPAPHTVYEGIFKLEPAHYVVFTLDCLRAPVRKTRYWHPRTEASKLVLPDSPLEQTNHLHDLLRTAVGLQMSADVPLGAFLSGGIDSSLVVSLMQSQTSTPVKTFTIGFEEEACNEAPYADAVARHLGTAHTTQIISERDALSVIPKRKYTSRRCPRAASVKTTSSTANTT